MVDIGDFSFARSLYEHHRCKNVFATCYDSEETLLSKYHGQAEENIKHFLDEPEDQDNEDDVNENEDEDDIDTKKSQTKSPARKVLYSVDARKLGSNTGGGKDIRKGIPPPKNRKSQPYHRKDGQQPERNHHDNGGPWDIISFNFPHVGGLSTDVNRQVRANQELLVAFFKACVPLLSKTPRKEDDQNHVVDDDYDNYSFGSETSESESEEEEEENQDKMRTIPRPSGQIIVTLFEGEPYTLWNIKDLARHAGLVVVTSFKFPWKSYPGYSHARTLGIVESRSSKQDGDDETERKGGGWKGEDREARSYVFEVKGESGQQRRHGQQKKNNQDGGKGNKKRGKGDDSSDED
jgi:25S rRNA (uracil2634-N3)-methyltransferase